MAFIKAAGPIFKHIGDGEWIWSVLAILGGFHSLNNAPGCSNLWFVYTLIIIKIVYQLANKRVNFLLVLFCFWGAWVYNDVLIECQLTVAFIQSYAVWSGRREKGEKHRVHSTSHVDDDIVMGGMYHMPYFPDVFEKAMALFVFKWD